MNTTRKVDRNTNVSTPQPLDILRGQGKSFYQHEGSRRYRLIIAMNSQRYRVASTKEEKMNITKQIFQHFQDLGSRFLKYNKTTKSWQQISQAAACDKISHAIRFATQEEKRGKPSLSCPVQCLSTDISPTPYNRHPHLLEQTPVEENQWQRQPTEVLHHSEKGDNLFAKITIGKNEGIHRKDLDQLPYSKQQGIQRQHEIETMTQQFHKRKISQATFVGSPPTTDDEEINNGSSTQQHEFDKCRFKEKAGHATRDLESLIEPKRKKIKMESEKYFNEATWKAACFRNTELSSVQVHPRAPSSWSDRSGFFGVVTCNSYSQTASRPTNIATREEFSDAEFLSKIDHVLGPPRILGTEHDPMEAFLY